MLKGKKILLGVSGGIAAYKAASLASLLVRQGCQVSTVMTENARRIIGAAVFEALTHRRVYDSAFDRFDPACIPHIALAEEADALVIAPATADIIAKAACGLADDMLSTVILPCTCPKIVVPAMNTRMYDNAATQENLQTLRRRGWTVMDPAEGHLACGETGRGKMPEPEDIAEFIDVTIGHEKDLQGQKVLVTAGPTCEALDPVRYITNHSTGRMGYAVAKAAAMRGAEVTLVSGPTVLKTPPLTARVDVTSAREMFDAVTSRFDASSIVIMSAAVADYRPASVAENKIKKSDGTLELQLVRTPDILKYLGEHRTHQTICGFSMETEHLIENSRAKLAKKHVQIMAANSLKVPGAGFGTDTNVLTLITARSTVELPLMSKEEAAHCLLDEILKIRQSAPQD